MFLDQNIFRDQRDIPRTFYIRLQADREIVITGLALSLTASSNVQVTIEQEIPVTGGLFNAQTKELYHGNVINNRDTIIPVHLKTGLISNKWTEDFQSFQFGKVSNLAKNTSTLNMSIKGTGATYSGISGSSKY